MASFLRLLVLSLLFSLALPAAANEKFGQVELDAQKELLQLKIDSSRELTQKDVDSLKNRIEALDERLDDQNNRVGDIGQAVDRFAVITGIAGLVVTLLLALVGLIGYLSVTRQAKEEAKTASRQWFDSNHEDLLAQIDELKKKAVQGHQAIEHSVNEVVQKRDAAITQMQERMKTSVEDGAPINRDEEAALRQSAEDIRAKPEASYSFDDWNTRAFDAYHAKQYEDAALYWKHASSIPNAGAANSAQALLNRALTLHQLKRHAEAGTAYQQLIDTYSSDNTPAIREQVAKAMVNTGVSLGEMQKPTEAIATYKQLIATYSSDTTPAIRTQVAGSMLNMGIALGEIQQPDEAIATYQQLIDSYSSDNIPLIREQVAKAMLSMGITHGQMQQLGEAIASYQQLIDSYSSDNTPAIREQAAKAVLNMGITFGQVQKPNEAIATYQQLIATYSSDNTPAIRELVAKAMLNMGIVLGQMQQPAEKIAIYRQLITTYSSDTTPAIREQVAIALNSKGFAALMKAKNAWQNREQALSLLSEAHNDLLASLERRTDCGMTRGNLAYVQWLLGETLAAENSFRSALAAPQDSGEELYHGTVADIEQHTIAEDEGFRAMIERLWAEHQAAKSSGD
ncbi:tetratricopeptide repeat protein [Vogesella sp. AC12]|uniref:tetratricopeptide repeat protein n=1 Tax=Vogesella sp. AC12 TaxID=2950550 RepID=UPI00210ED622|nr:tetratricopeptide repeat protein [Vogesella sp. AC12]MCQ4143712.1 tetratricopeptide repeat protein [Vogesella sp. AC12]